MNTHVPADCDPAASTSSAQDAPVRQTYFKTTAYAYRTDAETVRLAMAPKKDQKKEKKKRTCDTDGPAEGLGRILDMIAVPVFHVLQREWRCSWQLKTDPAAFQSVIAECEDPNRPSRVVAVLGATGTGKSFLLSHLLGHPSNPPLVVDESEGAPMCSTSTGVNIHVDKQSDGEVFYLDAEGENGTLPTRIVKASWFQPFAPHAKHWSQARRQVCTDVLPLICVAVSDIVLLVTRSKLLDQSTYKSAVSWARKATESVSSYTPPTLVVIQNRCGPKEARSPEELTEQFMQHDEHGAIFNYFSSIQCFNIPDIDFGAELFERQLALLKGYIARELGLKIKDFRARQMPQSVWIRLFVAVSRSVALRQVISIGDILSEVSSRHTSSDFRSLKQFYTLIKNFLAGDPACPASPQVCDPDRIVGIGSKSLSGDSPAKDSEGAADGNALEAKPVKERTADTADEGIANPESVLRATPGGCPEANAVRLAARQAARIVAWKAKDSSESVLRAINLVHEASGYLTELQDSTTCHAKLYCPLKRGEGLGVTVQCCLPSCLHAGKHMVTVSRKWLSKVDGLIDNTLVSVMDTVRPVRIRFDGEFSPKPQVRAALKESRASMQALALEYVQTLSAANASKVPANYVLSVAHGFPPDVLSACGTGDRCCICFDQRFRKEGKEYSPSLKTVLHMDNRRLYACRECIKAVNSNQAPSMPEPETATCVICITDKPHIQLQPCGHLCYCLRCFISEEASKWMDSCPLCRSDVTVANDLRFANKWCFVCMSNWSTS